MAQKPTSQCGKDYGNESSNQSVRLRICVGTEHAASQQWRRLDEAEPEKLLLLLWRQQSGRRAMVSCDEVRMLTGAVRTPFACQLSESIPVQHGVWNRPNETELSHRWRRRAQFAVE